MVVNCVGVFGGVEFCCQVGFDVLIVFKKCCVFIFECWDIFVDFLLLIDLIGIYVWFEGIGYICGFVLLEEWDLDCIDFDVDYGFFEEYIWLMLVVCVLVFEVIWLGVVWVGIYDMNLFDYNVFVGDVFGFDGYYLVLGFFGYGLQQLFVVGCGLVELIVIGIYQLLDLLLFGFDWFVGNCLIVEKNVV